jgi:fructokinase
MAVFGGIEAGGTKFVCAVGNGPDDLREAFRFPTTTPAETLEKAITYFQTQAKREPLLGVGIASFGPVDPNPNSPTYGYITTTPKPGWPNTDFVGTVQEALKIPIGFDTDVNAAALGEYRWGAGQGLDTLIYLTVGTGIGGGGVINGKLIHGMMHPEMGHVRIPHDKERDPYPGLCPYHKNCFEGLANGPALMERWGQPAETLAPDHRAWALEAHYIALALVNYILVLSPQRIILGGGVMQQMLLFPMIRAEVKNLLNDYLNTPEILEHLDTYIVPPGLGNRSGVLGAIALAADAARAQPAKNPSRVITHTSKN